MKGKKEHDAVAAARLMEAWKERDRILSDDNLYCQELDWEKSGGSFLGCLPMPIGLILECWIDGGPFILPDGRHIFHFKGGLSGVCDGSAIDLNTGEISTFCSNQGNDLCFQILAKKRAEILRAHNNG